MELGNLGEKPGNLDGNLDTHFPRGKRKPGHLEGKPGGNLDTHFPRELETWTPTSLGGRNLEEKPGHPLSAARKPRKPRKENLDTHFPGGRCATNHSIRKLLERRNFFREIVFIGLGYD
jgi:hypothetical protein